MERFGFPSHRVISVRSIFTFVIVVVVTALLLVLTTSHEAKAATTATWSGTDTILFDGRGFTKASSNLRDTTGTIPSGATSYQSQVQTGSGSSSQRIFILYFSPGVDPPTATSVKYAEFDYDNGRLTNVSAQQDVTLAEQGTSDTTGSSCSVGGVGWIICPLTSFLADAMDNVFAFLSDNFIKVQPVVLGDTNNSLYIAWNVMRSVANVAFVIVFLIIIYSQLTNVGISNYGIKKLIPRLVVAAVLVNVSFYVAALAIDLSNVLGYSVQDVFNSIREQTFNMTNDNTAALNDSWGTSPWTNVTAVVLAGGGAIGGIYYIAGAGLYFLVPLLIGLLLTLIFVVIILAARQAIIIILVIIAPVAFVANLLPNTEKWYKQWQDLFFTMLIFFPAFSLVFGGSQLAGQLIIQNAGDNIVTVIFGLAIQIAPLVITPLILKFSGGLLGKIAQITNNPRKGIMDRPQTWANERSEIRRQRELGKKASWYTPNRAARQFLNNNQRNRKKLIENLTQEADNKWEQTPKFSKLDEQATRANLDKERIHAEHTAHTQGLMKTSGTELNRIMVDAEKSKTKSELNTQAVESMRAELRAGKLEITADTMPALNAQQRERLEGIQQSMAQNVMETTALKRAAEGANIVQQYEYATQINSPDLFRDTGRTLKDIAAGIDPNGAQRAQASATAVIQEIRTKTIDNMQKIISFKNPTPAEILELMKGNAVRGIEPTQDAVAAAVKMTFGGGDTSQILAGLQQVDLSFTGPQYAGFTADEREELQILAGQTLSSNGSKPPFATFGITGKMTQGKNYDGSDYTGALGEGGLNNLIVSVVEAGKVDSGKLQTAGKDYSEALLNAVRTAPPGAISAERRSQLLEQLNITLDPNREAYEKLGDSQDALKTLRDSLR